METIGARVRGLRKEMGLTQAELAARAGVDQSTISDIERGKSFGAEVLMAVCQALLKSPQFIMTGRAEALELTTVEVNMIAAYRRATEKAAPKPDETHAPTTAPAGPSVRKVSAPAAKARKQQKVG
ncbi:Transcriptional regulator, contains XRE-family HTH domain [Rhizobacter sp. OV335]|nr:helix-turn-helix transcriptional regulator [Rhizobacter sp. OV335]SHN40554.1 Transcriptional regulator, contains XRE-family HTH domain [Rhizobacter sp. OV335]